MLRKFNQFILESSINESVLYFSPKLRKNLKLISNRSEIAKRLLDKEGTDTGKDITLLDFKEGDWGYLTYINMDSAIKKLEGDWGADAQINDIIDTRFTDYIWDTRHDSDDSPYNKNRNAIKIGKIIRYILGSGYDSNQIEGFTNLIRSLRKDQKERMYIVKGDDIVNHYNVGNYYDTSGSLGSSCMNNKPKSFFNIYVKNSDVCSLLVLKMGDYVVGRTLVWKLNSIKDSDGKDIKCEYYMDRVYTKHDYYINKFINYAKERGWCYRKYNSNFYNYVYFKDKSYTVKMTVKIKEGNYGEYPYMDTFARYEQNKGILHSDTKSRLGGHILQKLDGGYQRSINVVSRVINKFSDFIRRD